MTGDDDRHDHDRPRPPATRDADRPDAAPGTVSAVVDRIVDRRMAVLLVEDDGDGQEWTIALRELPDGITDGTWLWAVRGGQQLRVTGIDHERTAERRRDLGSRMERLRQQRRGGRFARRDERQHDRRHAADDRTIPAPQLRETADIWFDSGVDPAIRWDREGRRFELIDPQAAADGYQGDEPDEASDRSLLLYEAPYPLPDPARIAQVLADGLAACDFPPTAERAHPGHVASALRAANIDPDAP